MNVQTLLLSPRGRIRRRDFWIGFAIVMAGSFLIGLIPIVGPILGFVMLWPQICIHAKRLHDMGWSAWIMLVPAAVTLTCMILVAINGGAALLTAPPAEAFAVAALPEMDAARLYLAIAMLFGLAFLLWVGLSKGNRRDNRFGRAPLS